MLLATTRKRWPWAKKILDFRINQTLILWTRSENASSFIAQSKIQTSSGSVNSALELRRSQQLLRVLHSHSNETADSEWESAMSIEMNAIWAMYVACWSRLNQTNWYLYVRSLCRLNERLKIPPYVTSYDTWENLWEAMLGQQDDERRRTSRYKWMTASLSNWDSSLIICDFVSVFLHLMSSR